MFQIVASTEPLHLTDAKSIRALAHPARFAVLEELGSGGELTATECAEIVGLSPSAMSYHLRSLERAGMIERAPSAGDGRERPWRLVDIGNTHVRVDTDALPGGAALDRALTAAVVDRLRAQYEQWSRRRSSESAQWRDASGVVTSLDWMRADELAELTALVTDKIDEFRGRSADERPEGSRRVRVALFGFPVDQRQ